MQLIATIKLHQEAPLLHSPDRLATSNDLQKAISDIKEAVASSHGHPMALEGRSYATVRCTRGTPSNQAMIQKQNIMAKLQQKQIFVSLQTVARDAPILKWEPAILTRYL